MSDEDTLDMEMDFLKCGKIGAVAWRCWRRDRCSSSGLSTGQYMKRPRLHFVACVCPCGALPLDPMELTRDLKNGSEPSLELNLQADSSVSHQRSESCLPSQYLLSAPSQRTRRSRRATLSYTTGSMTIPPGGFPCAYL
ncbi:hypothetical protein CHARACLAT_008313 [Characodon lateralis]|uniref:Uncharacterized protein n=1 Tax=Characodon lateralis TaxID=208331 RepID=A0ABU7EHK4_9TELE|nr:hypothetical protein [Characodon lateralis]